MAYFVVSNFASGRDMRRSQETTASGALRTLRNAFINEGGEIEKRKAFIKQDDLSAYGQGGSHKGLISGPFPVPNVDNTVFFRHRTAAMPGAPFSAGSGSAEFLEEIDAATGLVLQKFWVAPSAIALPAQQALLHTASHSLYGTTSYLVERHYGTDAARVAQHVQVTFTGDEPTAELEVVVNDGRAFQYVLGQKGYVADGQTIYSSALGDPADMVGSGSWTNDITTQGNPIGEALAIAEYFGQLVIFGSKGAQFWSIDVDPDLNQYNRSVKTSVFGARAVVGYGAGDILYLSKSGVRSLDARDSSNLARISDVGSPIDLEIRAQLQPDRNDTDPFFAQINPEVSNAVFYDLASSIVHQESGQFWLALRDQVHVLSRYPSAGVQAWSSFDLPTADAEIINAGSVKAGWVADWCEIGDSIILRNFADEVYVYGGPDGSEYDDAEVEVIVPFMDMGRSGSQKHFRGFDIVCEGEWDVFFATESQGEDRDIYWAPAGTVTGSTRGHDRIGFDARGTQIAMRLLSRSSFAAKISEITIHYNEGGQK